MKRDRKGDFCPITGEPVFTRPEWTEVRFGKTLRATFKLIGGNILLMQPRGYARLDDIRGFVAFSQGLLDELLLDGRSTVVVEDLEKLQGISVRARRYYIARGKVRARARAVIFCNAGVTQRMAILLARRLGMVKTSIHLAEDYGSALALAQKILSQETALRPGPTTEVRKRPELPGIGSFKRISRSEWVLRQEGFYTRLEVIEEKILHSVSRGSLKAVHIPEIDRLRERVRREMGLEEGFDYIVAEICGLQGTDRKTRLRYMRSILGWHRSWPLKGYFFYGSNRFMKTVISLAKPLMPFPVRTVGGLEEALEMITRRRPEKAGNRSPGPVKRPSLVCNWGYRKEAQVEEILSFLADIDWERENPVPEHRKEPSHPFFEVFEAISLINNELDELLRERDRSEEEKMRMEACLRRNEKLEAVGTLAGGIAHDFNNILAAIVGYAELARHELPEENRAREYLEQILVSSFRAKELVQQMLNFARRSARDRKPVVVSRLIEKAFEQLKPSLPPGIKIKLEHSFEEGVVLADQEQIQQVLVNVIDNGVRAMGNKDGVLEVGLERVRLNGKRLSGETELEPGHYLEIRVRDTGVGMKKEVIGRIFEPFFTTRETGQGRGMGLAVVHGIVKVHGGEVRVKSKPGQGSTFSIMLPLMGEDNRDNYGISIKENQINLTSSDLSKEF